MNRIILGLALTALAPIAAADGVKQIQQIPGMEAVKTISVLSGIDGWQAVDEDTLIVWATPFRPYLIELDHKSRDLPFVEKIGITTTTSQIRVNADSVRVRGLSYSIRGIYRLDRDEAHDLVSER
jgi:Family of unknown function (DUF6491)